uniref:Uncharacterized protein n=1 Tax=Aegilops tauschii subsp. strangulata TaxID=200361 RepID=A0A453DDE9_AEGTS
MVCTPRGAAAHLPVCSRAASNVSRLCLVGTVFGRILSMYSRLPGTLSLKNCNNLNAGGLFRVVLMNSCRCSFAAAAS